MRSKQSADGKAKPAAMFPGGWRCFVVRLERPLMRELLCQKLRPASLIASYRDAYHETSRMRPGGKA